MVSNENVSEEEEISNLVDRFYAKVRRDDLIGPIFNAMIDDWPFHLAKLKSFWTSVMLGAGTYKGNPMMVHMQLPLDPEHFHRWLTLFAETANEVMVPEHANLIIQKSHFIGQNFQAGIAYQKLATATQG
ncbi:MAG: group III truncated hemoglobin [Edaphobacter sp.]